MDNTHLRYLSNVGVYCPILYLLVPAAEIRDHETGLVSGPFSWFQSRLLFCETHETEANPISINLSSFRVPYVGLRLHIYIKIKQFIVSSLRKSINLPILFNDGD